MKKLLLIVPMFLLVACNPPAPETSDFEPPKPPIEDNRNGEEADHGNDIVDETEEGNDAVIDIYVETSADEEGNEDDYLIIKTGDEAHAIKLGVSQAGETKAYDPGQSGANDTIAEFRHHWAGSTEVYRVRHVGHSLVVEKMGYDEGEGGQLGCNPWEEVKKVDIGLTQRFLVQEGLPLLDAGMQCDCEDTGTDGWVCA